MGEIKCYDCKLVDDRNNNFCQTCYQNGEAMNYMPKDDDQTAKKDGGKLDLTLVPTKAIRDCAIVREYGNKKYGSRDNWKQVSIERYTAALFRHLLAFIDDPDGVDEESGIPHFKHILCNACFISALRKD